MTARRNLVGVRFHRLFVFAFAGKRGAAKMVYWLCHCDCGGLTEVSRANLVSGSVKSCGCFRREFSGIAQPRLDHGHYVGGKASPTYRSWQNMLERCRSNTRYIQRNITVCEQWSKFRRFLDDMGERPRGHTLDRYPNRNGNYEPSNCRWATPKQQANNRNPAGSYV